MQVVWLASVAALVWASACKVDDPSVRGTGYHPAGDIGGLSAGTSATGGGAGAGSSGVASDGAPAGMGGMPVATGGGGEPPLASIGGSEPPMGGTGGGLPPERMFNAGGVELNNVQAGNVCTRLAQIQCAGEEYCCNNPGRDRAACEAAQFNTCASELYLDSVSANPIVNFDASAAASALTQLQTMASQCDPTIGAYGASAAGLLSMFHGTVEAGKSCRPLGLDNAAAAAALASCANPTTTACLPANTLSWSCSARGGAGTPCFTDLNCQEGLMCPNPNLAFGEVACAARKPAGSPCGLANECESISCKGGVCAPVDAQSAYCLL